jgi:hypothetical protein
MFASSAVAVPTPPVAIATVVVVVIRPIVEVSVIAEIASMTVEVTAFMSSPVAVSTATPETAAVSTATLETAAAMSTATSASTPASQSFSLQHAASQSDTGNNNHDFLQHDILLSRCLCISLDFTLQHGSKTGSGPDLERCNEHEFSGFRDIAVFGSNLRRYAVCRGNAGLCRRINAPTAAKAVKAIGGSSAGSLCPAQ